MNIVFINENSQASKNSLIFGELVSFSKNTQHKVFNFGQKNENDGYLTYIHLGIMGSMLLNSKSADFIITGCGTGQGALMSLNAHPGVFCGYCIDPSDAYLFSQINQGNSLSIPFAKGFGWGSELNLKYIFEKAFPEIKMGGYPVERKEVQVKNANILLDLKNSTNKSFIESLESIDSSLFNEILIRKDFVNFILENSKVKELNNFINLKIKSLNE